MSSFSQQDAEHFGWQFVHAQAATTLDRGDGLSQMIPGIYRAERPRNGGLIHEEAETPEKLLERIRLYEQHLVRVGAQP